MEYEPKTRAEELANVPRVRFWIEFYKKQLNNSVPEKVAQAEKYLEMLRDPEKIQGYFEEVVADFPMDEEKEALEKVREINKKYKESAAATSEKFVVDPRIIEKIDQISKETWGQKKVYPDREKLQVLAQAKQFGLKEAKSKDEVKKIILKLFEDEFLSEPEFLQLAGYLEGKPAEPISTPELSHETPPLGIYEKEGEKLTDIELLKVAWELYHDKEGDISLTSLETALRIGTSRAAAIKELLDKKRTENLASNNIKPPEARILTPEEEEALKDFPEEIKKLPEEEKEQMGFGMQVWGFKLEQLKNEGYAAMINGGLKFTTPGGAANRYFTAFKNSFSKDAEEARRRGGSVKEGRTKDRLKNMGLLAGNLLKYGRIGLDWTGVTPGSWRRALMTAGMVTTRLMDVGKEARFLNEDLLNTTRIADVEKAQEEALALAATIQAKNGGKPPTAEELKNEYLLKMPKELSARLQNPGTGNKFIAMIARTEIEFWMKRANDKVEEIEKGSLPPEEKGKAKLAVLKKYESKFREYDHIVDNYGTIDEVSTLLRAGRTLGKGFVLGMQADTLRLGINYLYENAAKLLTSDTEIPQSTASSSAPAPQPQAAPALKKVETTPQAPVNVTPSAPTQPSAPDTSANVTPPQTPAPTTPAGIVAPAAPEPVAPKVETPVATSETIKEAIVGKGEGIEHALRRQIEADAELAKALGFEGDVTDKDALHKFSGGAAHRVALYKGYVDKVTGEEIRVGQADKIAYKLTLSGNEADPFKVEELKIEDGKPISVESHGNEPEFEGDKKEDYEYRQNRIPVHTEAGGGTSKYETVELDEITTPGSENEALTTEEIEANKQRAETLKNMGYEGDPNNKKEVEEFFARQKLLNSYESAAQTPEPGTEEHMKAMGVGQESQEEMVRRNWNILKKLNAREVVRMNEKDRMGAIGQLSAYLNELQKESQLAPKGGWFRPEESVEKYVARALNKIQLEKQVGVETGQGN